MDALADTQSQSPSPSPPPPLGQLLAGERERQGMSRADVAQRLHMSTWQVEALETGDYGRLPKGTFLRGFVRNYAKVLGLNAEAALAALSAAAPTGPAPGIVVPTQNIRFDPLGERFSGPHVRAWSFAAVTLVAVLAGMYWWSSMRTSPPAQVAERAERAPAPAPRNLAAVQMPAAEPVAAPREAPRVEEPVAAAEPAKSVAKDPPRPAPSSPVTRAVKPPDVLPVTIAAPNPVRAPGMRTVTLRFKGKSWVEIKDRFGKVLLSQLNDPGSEAEVSGRPPLSVIVGNAPDVTLLYDDREFPLEPHTRVAVARFTLE
jgi:cytoskeleton protein RodZ